MSGLERDLQEHLREIQDSQREKLGGLVVQHLGLAGKKVINGNLSGAVLDLKQGMAAAKRRGEIRKELIRLP